MFEAGSASDTAAILHAGGWTLLTGVNLMLFSLLHNPCSTTLFTIYKETKSWKWTAISAFLPLVMAGQNNLIDSLKYRPAMPLASRVVARSHLEGANLALMTQYIAHHLSIAGVKQNLFEDAAAVAVYQGSGGLFRKANHLSRGALIAAARQKSTTITAEHVRLAATEIF